MRTDVASIDTHGESAPAAPAEECRELTGQARDESSIATFRRALLGGTLACLSGAFAPPARAGGGGFSREHFLARRLTFGANPTELALADTLGYDAYLEYHLLPEIIDDSALDVRLIPYTTLDLEPYEMITCAGNECQALPGGMVRSQLMDAVLLRSTLSRRQLFERLVELWTDHFNIYIYKDICQYLKTIDDRVVIRANAMRRFRDLLSASVHSPAMLFYLDNDLSSVGNLNENYARELMELHTLGVDGGYTQQDVRELARCLTGWTRWPMNAGTSAWSFRFRREMHDTGEKTVLENLIPAGGGIEDGEYVIRVLAEHPSTARMISRKLCTYFWGENPPASLVDAVAGTYSSTGGDIRAMLRTLFRTIDPSLAPPIFKRPYHFTVSLLRMTGMDIQNLSYVRDFLRRAGQGPFQWIPPDGYPFKFDFWAGSLLPRWNMATTFVSAIDYRWGVYMDIDAFLGGATTPDGIVAAIDDRLFAGEMLAYDRQRIRQYLIDFGVDDYRRRDVVALAICSPSFQWF